MADYIPPLSVFFVWHPADNASVKPVVDNCSSLLSRDIERPFSRSMDLPLFYRTSMKGVVPAQVNVLSERAVIFPFVSRNVVADDTWAEYVERLPSSKAVHIVPIALDDTAFSLKGNLEGTNFIRAYEFDDANKNDLMFISVAHEVYRYALNESFAEMEPGKENALKVFLSHAKDGKNGFKLAKALKEFIDNTPIRNFFDATDIAPGYKFDQEIIAHIKESSVIAIHSDSYSGRYWCQREILSAKEYDRPVVVVDALEDSEDRRFPFAANVPTICVHADGNPDTSDLLRILRSTLLETVRFFYSKLLLNQFRKAGWVNEEAHIRSRPPEIADIEKIFEGKDGSIARKLKALVYPEPPVYPEEVSFLTNLGISVTTPLTSDFHSLEGKRIGISMSDLPEEELVDIGQGGSHLAKLSQELARHLLSRHATLVYGGDLRQNGFTEFLFTEAQALQSRLRSDGIYVEDYLAWPICRTESAAVTEWRARFRTVARITRVSPPSYISDLVPTDDSLLPSTEPHSRYVWSCCLTEMRYKMIESCSARIVAGGKHAGYRGKMPGVLEEIGIALELKRPVFLLGGFGGVTASVCEFIRTGTIPERLTHDWQVLHNPGYKELLDFCCSRGERPLDYTSIAAVLGKATADNGLSREDNDRLAATPFIEEAIHLVLKGLNQLGACAANTRISR